MMNKKFGHGDKISLPVPADTPSGAPVIVGSIVGVTATAEGEGGNDDGYATVWCVGTFDVPIATSTTRSVGQPVYIITATNSVTTTDNSAANPLFGYVLEAKGSTAGQVVAVRLAKV